MAPTGFLQGDDCYEKATNQTLKGEQEPLHQNKLRHSRFSGESILYADPKPKDFGNNVFQLACLLCKPAYLQCKS